MNLAWATFLNSIIFYFKLLLIGDESYILSLYVNFLVIKKISSLNFVTKNIFCYNGSILDKFHQHEHGSRVPMRIWANFLEHSWDWLGTKLKCVGLKKLMTTLKFLCVSNKFCFVDNHSSSLSLLLTLE